MKPYCNTFRASKVHKSENCGICSEDTKGGSNYQRKKAKREIEKELVVIEEHPLVEEIK